MDGDDRRRTQYGQQSYPMPISSPSTTSPAQQVSYQPGDRFAQPLQPTTRVESSRIPVTRPSTLPSYGSYGYPESQSYAGQAMQGGNLPYQASFSPEAARMQQPGQISPQQYPQYQGQVLYNIAQPAPSQLPYDPIPQYQQRHSAAVEVLSNQFGVPQYYASGEPASSVPAAQAHFVASQNEPMRYPPQTPVGRPSVQQQYDVEMDYSPMGPPNPQEQQQVVPASDNMEEAYNRYQHQLKMAYEAISAGRLAEAGEGIMDLSRWLLSNVAKLGESAPTITSECQANPPGLHQDEQNPQFEPIQVWRDFNHCWLALGQKQMDLTEEAIRYRLSDSTVLPAETIVAMVDELIRLCDSIEQHGLVDYDRGVWEEEIIGIFMQCLDLLRPPNHSQGGQGYPSTRPG